MVPVRKKLNTYAKYITYLHGYKIGSLSYFASNFNVF